jgi:hypothetical protein
MEKELVDILDPDDRAELSACHMRREIAVKLLAGMVSNAAVRIDVSNEVLAREAYLLADEIIRQSVK